MRRHSLLAICIVSWGGAAGCSGRRRAPADAPPPPMDGATTEIDPILGCADDGVSYRFLRPGEFTVEIVSALDRSSPPAFCVVAGGTRDCRPISYLANERIRAAAGDTLQVQSADGQTLLDASLCPGDRASMLVEWSTRPAALAPWDTKRKLSEVSAMLSPLSRWYACSDDRTHFIVSRAGRYDFRTMKDVAKDAPGASVCVVNTAKRECHDVGEASWIVDVNQGDQVRAYMPDRGTELTPAECSPESSPLAMRWSSRQSTDHDGGSGALFDVAMDVRPARSARPGPSSP
jgi:hypothetical protein